LEKKEIEKIGTCPPPPPPDVNIGSVETLNIGRSAQEVNAGKGGSVNVAAGSNKNVNLGSAASLTIGRSARSAQEVNAGKGGSVNVAAGSNKNVNLGSAASLTIGRSAQEVNAGKGGSVNIAAGSNKNVNLGSAASLTIGRSAQEVNGRFDALRDELKSLEAAIDAGSEEAALRAIGLSYILEEDAKTQRNGDLEEVDATENREVLDYLRRERGIFDIFTKAVKIAAKIGKKVVGALVG